MLKEGVSVIICCYNSSLIIEETLKHLAAQQLSGIPCEIILVDNASTDNTAKIANVKWLETGNSEIDFKTTFEPTPGLAFARNKGIETANYRFFIFCDDDNLLDKKYVENVYRLFNKYPEIAVLGGLGVPEFETQESKPAWFDALYHGYAVGPQANSESKVNMVYGAGMAVRTSVLKEIMGKPTFLHDRKQNQLTSGGDSEICSQIRLAGHSIMYSPQLTFKHFLPAKRLTWNYLKKLHLGFANSFVVLNLYETALNSHKQEISAFYWLKKGLYYWGIYLKYWPKHWAAYKNTQGTIDEIRHIEWRRIALDYFEYNFKTISIYRKIAASKKSTHIFSVK